MRIKLYREYGALNSGPVFSAVETGLKRLGHTIVTENEDLPVIWSVLWSGRMAANRAVFEKFKNLGKNILIIEVGNLKRGQTWRLSFNHINQQGIFPLIENLDLDRPKKLGVQLQKYQSIRKNSILIAAQHDKSLQWQGLPALNTWCTDLIGKIRQFSQRPIVVRPHPRCRFSINLPNVTIEVPKQITGTYDDFDIDYNFHCVVNHNSGPAIQAAINGVPIICNHDSLAYPVSDQLKNIETISLPEREQWFTQLVHTEWTVDEIASGEPLQKLLLKTS